MGVQDDEGKLWDSRWSNGSDVNLEYNDTGQGRWWKESWGRTNRGSVCPSAPERVGKDRPAIPFSARLHYPGAVNTAWALERSDGPWTWWAFNEGTFGRRVGSYKPNSWMMSPNAWWTYDSDPPQEIFRSQTEVEDSARTPLFADGIFWIGMGGNIGREGPRATDAPARNLVTGTITMLPVGMCAFTIPRHGSTPSRVTTAHPPQAKLPGAINVAFHDGHVEQVKLEQLWQLSWHRNYVPPNKRPGS